MPSRSVIAAVLLLAGSAVLGGCTPVSSLNGFVAVDVQPSEIKVGTDTRTSVATKLGSPSTTSAFDKSTWYYITQTSDKMAYLQPVIKTRQIVAIRFDKDEKVTEVKSLDLHDGYDVAYNKRETPTRGRELSWLEQIIGTIGRGGMLPQDNDPGNTRPGGGSGGAGPH